MTICTFIVHIYATDSFILRKNGYGMLVAVDFTALVEIKSAMSVSLFYNHKHFITVLKQDERVRSIYMHYETTYSH